MKKRILFATKNHDKFKLVSNLFKAVGYVDYDFDYLGSINLPCDDIKEVGSVTDRAKQKAIYIKNFLKEKNNNDFVAVIGVDDGIMIGDEIKENVKDLILPIIKGELLKDSEIIYICRAFFIISGNKTKEIFTKIPFKYKKTDNVEIKENSYPLSHTLTTIDNEIFISDMSKEEENNYYLKYCLDDIIKASKDLNLL